MTPKVRRFEPWCGVSREMLEHEAKRVAREVENYLRLPVTELRQKLSERGERWNQADDALHALVTATPEHERLAVQCILVRDLHLILELYPEYLRSRQLHEPALVAEPRPVPPAADVPRAPFAEWLFGQS